MHGKAKIIAVGFQKTGLTSLYMALEILGYRVTTGRQSYKEYISPKEVVRALNEENYALLFKHIENFDAITDNPWNVIYPAIDVAYPGSLFIHTVREEDEWLSSAKRYFKHRPDTQIRRWLYNVESCNDITDEMYLNRYRRHNRDILDYFKGRTDFVSLNIFEDQNWEKLCTFLNKPIIKLPFPHSNMNRIEMKK